MDACPRLLFLVRRHGSRERRFGRGGVLAVIGHDHHVPSLLGVFAHPDDESLSAGGSLARHAAAGAHTAVVTAT